MAAKIRKILPPIKEGDHFTLAEARAALRELMREGKIPPPDKRAQRKKSAAKAG
jgi:hypothetical protein